MLCTNPRPCNRLILGVGSFWATIFRKAGDGDAEAPTFGNCEVGFGSGRMGRARDGVLTDLGGGDDGVMMTGVCCRGVAGAAGDGVERGGVAVLKLSCTGDLAMDIDGEGEKDCLDDLTELSTGFSAATGPLGVLMVRTRAETLTLDGAGCTYVGSTRGTCTGVDGVLTRLSLSLGGSMVCDVPTTARVPLDVLGRVSPGKATPPRPNTG